MRVLLLGMGSRGDVQPMVALGERLVERGYAVSLAAAADFRDLVAGHGIDFEAFSFELEEGVRSDLGREWLQGSSTNQVREARLMRRAVAWTAEALAGDLERLVARADAVVSSALTFDAVDALVSGTSTPHVYAIFQPVWPSEYGPSLAFALRPHGRSVANLAWSLLAGRAAHDIVRPTGDLLRARRGLPRGSFRSYAAAARRTPTLLAVGRAVVPPAPDWPPAVRQTGFWFCRAPGSEPLDPALERFLDAGPPPVHLGFGSMPTADPVAVVRGFCAVLDRLGLRGVVSAGLAGLAVEAISEAGLPTSVLGIAGAPHEALFPRCSAVVHHGGAGTSAAAFRAGVPQVVVPHAADQPYWGRRVSDLGVGPRPIARKDLTPDRLGAALEVALSARARSTAYDLGVRVRTEDGADDAARHIDGFLRRQAVDGSLTGNPCLRTTPRGR
ncbi:glucosyltransferase [Intrasporangium oryzae NRRL B-24470]|uniref:Glucosyltransferase n=1 Tax=Intrasporangium oryzae NRRL B-24470 TaxID=1386089 RepID=W9GAW0_9MICO|nr:glycosyltransferase [Intrasporangium oryzae]EWT02367.1 glucosyltransferase [Intrasporangium oryzae NRRL B-24470]